MSEKYQVISVAGVLVVDNKFLFVERSQHDNFLPTYFEFPGGKVEFGESLEEALKREFFEETNLRVNVESMPMRTFSFFTDKGRRHSIELVYRVSLAKDESVDNLRLSKEHDSFRWLLPDEINSIKTTDEIKKNVLATKVVEKK